MNVSHVKTVGFVPPNEGRDTVGIIHGCLLTLVVCSWSAIHLNIPANDDTRWTIALRTGTWVLIAILAPEFVAFLAIRERCEVAWLMTRVNEALRLRAEELTSFPKKSSFLKSHDRIRDELTEPSAADGDDRYPPSLTKTESTSTVQEIANEISSTSISERSVTLTNSTSGAQVRPQWTVEHMHYIYMGGFELVFGDNSTFRLNALQFLALLETGHIKPPEISVNEIRALSKSDIFAKVIPCLQMFWLAVYLISRAAYRLPISTLELFTVGQVCCTLPMYLGWWNKAKNVGVPTKIPADVPLSRLRGLLDSEAIDVDRHGNVGRTDGKRVATSANLPHSRTKLTLVTLPSLLPAVVFGTSHLLGWGFYFASDVERVLWWTSAVCCLALPMSIVALSKLGLRFNSGLLNLGLLVLVLLYVSARIYMCVEMLAGLRELPARVYVDASWCRFIPHLGN